MNDTKIRRAISAGFLAFGLIGGVGSAPAAAMVTIVALGDSLTAGYGLAPGEAFPEQLQAVLTARGHEVAVINAGNSGDTASDGLARLEWSIPADADIVIVALGANDALRGISPAVTQEAVGGILEKLSERGQSALLAGMLAPPNLGDEYAAEFDRIYPELAEQYGVPLYPFFLEGVAADPALNQADGIHPNAAGVERMVEGILPEVEALIAAAGGD